MNSMNGSGDGFSFDLPDIMPEATALQTKPDLPAANADATADGVTLELKDVLAIAPDEIVWEDLPIPTTPVQPDDGVVDPPSQDNILLG